MSSSTKFTCFFMGSQSRLIQCAEIMIQKGHNICGVISDAATIINWVNEKELRHILPSDDIIEILKEEPFDLFFSIDNFSKVPREILSLPKLYAINFHDAPLPKYAGVNATNWAIINGETIHGITWHVMTEKIDAGDILKQKTFRISEGETALTLNARCYDESIKSFGELIDDLLKNLIKPIPQNLKNRTYFPRWKRPPGLCIISWEKSAEEIYALSRALEFGTYPNALGLLKLYVGEEAFIVKHVDVLDVPSTLSPGTIIQVKDQTIRVATSTHDVRLHDFISHSGVPHNPFSFLEKSGLREGSILPQLNVKETTTLSRIHEAFCKHEDFWVERLSDFKPVQLPYSHRTYQENSKRYKIDRFYAPLETQYTQCDYTTPGDFVLAAFILYLYRITGKEVFDIHFSDTMLKEEISGNEKFFSLPVPLRIEINPGDCFSEFYKTVEKQIALTKAHKSFAQDLLIRLQILTRNWNHAFTQKPSITVERVKQLSGHQPQSNAYFTVIIPDDGKECILLYNPNYLEERTIDRIKEQFSVLLKDVAIKHERPLSDTPILPEKEKHLLLTHWQGEVKKYPARGASLHHLFESHVKRSPDRTAIIFGNAKVTYREFDKRANQLGNYLQALGVVPEVLVGVFMERSIEMVLALYGILKAGGAYVPFDPAYPHDRLAFMMEDTKVPIILTQEHLLEKIPESNSRVISIDSNWEDISRESNNKPPDRTTPDNLAYVIYTSGSTGKPKGVMNSHRGICNRLLWMQDEYHLTENDCVIQKTPVSFDVSVWEFFWPLFTGARLVVAPPGSHKDSSHLIGLIRKHNVTTIHFVPSMLRVFLEDKNVRECRSLRRVVCSGEALSYELQELFFSKLDAGLHNLYGPTEAAVDVTYWACQRERGRHIVPIGRPVANTQIYILDNHMKPVPIGAPGELHIGGVQVARGYLNRPHLTKEKFVPDPFSTGEKARLYKTGDLARFLPDGEIEYLGRLDSQVKIRGFRIELGEIESVICQHQQISEAVVVTRNDDSGGPHIIAYVVPSHNEKPSVNSLRNFLLSKLPDYMVPSVFVNIEKIPLSPNGKVDRNALPEPPHIRPELEEAYVAPATALEKALADIWNEVLSIEEIGIHDNFFALGGNSLRIVKIAQLCEQKLGLDIPIARLFQYPTINSLGTYLSKDRETQPSYKDVQDRSNRRKAALLRRKRSAGKQS